MSADPAPPADGTVASADGVPIRYHAEGAGEPPLVFVHAWALDRRLWDAQVPRFAGQHRVVTLDLGGHGESGRGRAAWTIPAFGDDVRAVVEGLGLRRAILIGHSMGGPVILEAARRMPGRVLGLVPVDTLTNVERKVDPGELEAFLAGLRADFPATVGRFLREWMFVPSTDPALIERIGAWASAMPPEIAISAIQHAFGYDARPALRELAVPIRALNAGRFPTDLDAARRYAPQFDAVIMTGVGHYLMLEDPDRFNELLGAVLAELAAGKARRRGDTGA